VCQERTPSSRVLKKNFATCRSLSNQFVMSYQNFAHCSNSNTCNMCSTAQEIHNHIKLAFSVKAMTIPQMCQKLMITTLLLCQFQFHPEKNTVSDNAALSTLPLSFSKWTPAEGSRVDAHCMFDTTESRCVRKPKQCIGRQQLQPTLQEPSTASTFDPEIFFDTHWNKATSQRRPPTGKPIFFVNEFS